MIQQAVQQQMAMLERMMGPWNPGASEKGTTVMLKNIPNRYGRDMLTDQLNANYRNEYDFVYLPIDFNSKCNVGYAFINFRTPEARAVLPGFSSVKICEVTYARVQ